MTLRDPGCVERTGQVDRHLVVGLVHPARVPERGPDDLGSVDEALGPEEADRQLLLETRGSHRDRDGNRPLAGTGGPDLERLLAHHAVASELE